MDQGFATIPRSLLHDPTVPADAKLVYLMLSSHVGGNASAWPSHRRMALNLGMSISTVKRQLVWLREHGHVIWQARIGDNDARITNEYTLIAGSSSSSNEDEKPANKPSSHRAGGRSGRATPSSDRATSSSEGTDPSPSESDPLGPSDLTEEESFNESQRTNSTTSEVIEIRQDVERVCAVLAELVASNGSKHPTVTPAWRDSARLLIDKDGRTEQQILWLLNWCQSDPFWRANILSMPTFREKFDRLRLAAQREYETRKSSNPWVG